MELFKFRRSIIWIGLIIIVIGAMITLFAFSSLNFNINDLSSHFGTWYAPLTFHD